MVLPEEGFCTLGSMPELFGLLLVFPIVGESVSVFLPLGMTFLSLVASPSKGDVCLLGSDVSVVCWRVSVSLTFV